MTYAYDQRDRLVREEQPQDHALTTSDASWAAEERQRLGFAASAADLTDADKQALIAAYSVNYAYDGRNDRISIFYPLGQRTDEIYDGNGRMTESRLYLAGVPAVSRRAFDAYGNTIAEVDAEGRAKSKVYGGFGRLVQDIDEDGNRITSVYDVFGVRDPRFDERQDVRKIYDDAGRVTTIRTSAPARDDLYLRPHRQAPYRGHDRQRPRSQHDLPVRRARPDGALGGRGHRPEREHLLRRRGQPRARVHRHGLRPARPEHRRQSQLPLRRPRLQLRRRAPRVQGSPAHD
jgi:hypothetical protein